MGFGRRCKSTANRVLLDIARTAHELRFVHDLALVETVRPYFELAFQSKGKASLDELQDLFERNIGSRSDDGVEVVRHNDERVQKEFPLTTIVENRLLKEFRRRSYLEKATALRGHGGDEIRAGFLRCQPHVGSINGGPVAKANLIASEVPGA